MKGCVKMNKDQLLSLVNQLNLPKGEYSICSTGSLVIRGILEKAGDLDLQVTKECFNYIKTTFKLIILLISKYNFIRIRQIIKFLYMLNITSVSISHQNKYII